MIEGICGRCGGPSLLGPICSSCKEKGQDRYQQYLAAQQQEAAGTVRDLLAKMTAELDRHPFVSSLEVAGSTITWTLLDCEDEDESFRRHCSVSEEIERIKHLYLFHSAITVKRAYR